jgi:hypothetical protein
MLGNSSLRQKFIDLEADMLVETSEKFRDGACASLTTFSLRNTLSRGRWRCFRRAGRLVQATEFMFKAQNQATQDPEASKSTVDTIRSHVEASMEMFASMLGENAPYLLKLKAGAEANTASFAQHPAESTKQFVGTMLDLTSKSESKREEAKRTIDTMSIGERRELSPEEITEIANNLTDFGHGIDVESEGKRWWSSLRSLIPLTRKVAVANLSDANTLPKSLLQLSGDDAIDRVAPTRPSRAAPSNSRCKVNMQGFVMALVVMLVLLIFVLPLIFSLLQTAHPVLNTVINPILSLIVFLGGMNAIFEYACVWHSFRTETVIEKGKYK